MTGRLRITIGTVAAAAALAACGTGTAAARAPRTCTWGGTPAAPTGLNVNAEGISNTPSTHPIRFHATGRLGLQCRGRFRFRGVMDAGATCSYITFHARTYGIRGVARVEGVAAAGLSPARLYDRHGKLVGTENAQFLGDSRVVAECNSATGVVRNLFSSVIELF